MHEVLVGFDSAWTDNLRHPGAISVQHFENGVAGEFLQPCLATFDEAYALIERCLTSADLVVVAIDQPTIVPNLDGFRPVEKVVASVVGKLKGGVQPGRRGGGGASMFGDGAPIWRFLDRLDAVQDPERARAAGSGRFAMEVFPALALPSLIPAIWDRKRAAKYNPVGRLFLLDDWRLVCDGLACTALDLGLSALADWAKLQRMLGKPRKADQDRLDAALCLLIARHWRHAPRERSMVLGDPIRGYIVTPASEEIRAVLTRRRRRVPCRSRPVGIMRSSSRPKAEGIVAIRPAGD